MAVLVDNRAKWVAHRPKRYEYWQRDWCFCFSVLTSRFGTRLLVIHDQRLVSATDTIRQQIDTAYMKAVGRKAWGIDALFVAVAAGIRDTTLDQVRVTYDATDGYPVAIIFDRWVMATDDESEITVSHFRAIP